MIYRLLIRPILFLFDAEKVHDFVMKIISKITFLYPFIKFIYSPKNADSIEINGLKFRNRLGLAAGLDKNGEAIRFWDAIGFSHVEVGTVTPGPQKGNPKPRIFRLVYDNAIINSMGFNNKGADEILKNISRARNLMKPGFIIGVNIGKNKPTPLENAYEDYKICLEKLYDAADYFTLNVSSPNTKGLRDLQGSKYLNDLLKEITSLNIKLAGERANPPKKIFLKIAPDISGNEIEDIFRLVIRYDIDGIVATNTTITRRNISESIFEEGGLSGKPLSELSNKVLDKLNELNSGSEYGKISLIGSGGVFNKKDFKKKLNSGAELVQVYTGFIFEGMKITKKILS